MAASDKIRVIIVDDIAETRENIRKLLQFENDVEVIGTARTGREGCDLAKETKPDVVLMDINMPDMDGIQATETIKRTVPFAQMIILSVQSDPSYMRRAMLAGARDFLTKPPAVDELTGAIRRAGAMARDERAKMSVPAGIPQAGTMGTMPNLMSSMAPAGKIIVVYSPKGGTGCTTLVTNLAVSLKSDDTPVVLVDGNLQFGDVGVFMNEQGKNTVLDLASRADELEPEVVEGVLINNTATGVRILAAPSKPEHSESVTGDQFVKVLNYLRRLYTYILVDTSSTLTDATLGAIQDASDLIVLVTTQDIPAIKNCRLFLDLTDALGVSRQQVLLVMNRYDKRIPITPEKVGESLKQEIISVIPFDEKIVVPSVNRGIPFIVNNKAQPISRSVFQLMEVIRQRITEMDSGDQHLETAKSGLSKFKRAG